MSVQQMLQDWDIMDTAIVRHGFFVYNRDYFLEVRYSDAERGQREVTFLFQGCVEAHYQNIILPNCYPTFMDDRFIDYRHWEEMGMPEGFVWGVNEADAYPGWQYVASSEQAYAWSQKLSIPMHEIEIETNTYRLNLVFHDLIVKPKTGTMSDERGGR